MTLVRNRIAIRYNNKDRREFHLQFIIHLVGHGDLSDFRLEHIIESLFPQFSNILLGLGISDLTEK